jgi:hypothetical protein
VNFPLAESIGYDALPTNCPWYTNQLDGEVVVGNCYVKYTGTAPATVSLPAGIIGIAAYAFEDQTALTTLANTGSVKSIGVQAFHGCTALSSASLPAATSIGYLAFRYCTALATLTLGATPPTLGSNIFYYTSGGASNLITIEVPSASAGAYQTAWGITGITTAPGTTYSVAAGGDTSKWGDSHNAIKVVATP